MRSIARNRKVPVPAPGSTTVTADEAKPRVWLRRVRTKSSTRRTMGSTTSTGV